MKGNTRGPEAYGRLCQNPLAKWNTQKPNADVRILCQSPTSIKHHSASRKCTAKKNDCHLHNPGANAIHSGMKRKSEPEPQDLGSGRAGRQPYPIPHISIIIIIIIIIIITIINELLYAYKEIVFTFLTLLECTKMHISESSTKIQTTIKHYSASRNCTTNYDCQNAFANAMTST